MHGQQNIKKKLTNSGYANNLWFASISLGNCSGKVKEKVKSTPGSRTTSFITRDGGPDAH
jgi:hypothetical protein